MIVVAKRKGLCVYSYYSIIGGKNLHSIRRRQSESNLRNPKQTLNTYKAPLSLYVLPQKDIK